MAKSLETNRVEVVRGGAVLEIRLSGRWSIFDPGPGFEEVVEDSALEKAEVLRVDCGGVADFDSELLVFLLKARNESGRVGRRFEAVNLPEGLRRLLEQAPGEVSAVGPEKERRRRNGFLETIGDWAIGAAGRGREALEFTGEIFLSGIRLARRPGSFRWRDSLEAMQQTGAMALPIVGLISFLVGVIMAFQAAIQLRQFGADIFVANLVGLAVVREMGPMMAAVVLAGRTGAAFAAQIGTMKVNEEIDALQTLGVSPIDFLVMPRMLALFLMMPLLALYADFLGILGGTFVSTSVMDLTVTTYWAQTRGAIDLVDIGSGLIKAVAFGLLIAFAGCLRGLQCGRSSAGVGAAATSAVVTGILFVIVADAIFAVIFNVLGI